MITIVLPYAIPLWNEIKGWNKYWEYPAKREALAWEVAALIPWKQKPLAPFKKAFIRVERYSSGSPDPEGLNGKLLFDILQPRSRVHPNGLGIIARDNRKCLQYEIIPVHVKDSSLHRTIIIIEDLTP